MQKGLVKITSNKEKAKSILKMAEVSLKAIKTRNQRKFTSIVTKEYYEVIRELMSIVLLLDGYKTEGEGSHKKLIDYLSENYKDHFDKHEIVLLEELRTTRNKISYDGFFVPEDYLEKRIKNIKEIISKLKDVINKKF